VEALRKRGRQQDESQFTTKIDEFKVWVCIMVECEQNRAFSVGMRYANNGRVKKIANSYI
jgi:hypothetical protein